VARGQPAHSRKRLGKEAVVSKFPSALSLLRFGYRLFVGSVCAYVLISLSLGGSGAAKPAFYGLAGGWAALLCLYRFLPWQEIKLTITAIRARPFPRALGMIIGNLAVTLVLAEVSLRLLSAWFGASLLISDALDAHRLLPGHDYGGGLRGNSLGYPGPEFEQARRPGIFRIAALGDSFAVGPAVPFADNYLTLLEKALPRTEVYNFGVSGTGPREYRTILRRDVWTYQPNLVLVCVFVGNDITESLATPRHMDPRRHALYLLLARGWRLARECCRRAPTPEAIPSDRPEVARLSEASFREVEARRLEVCLNPPPAALERKWQRALDDLEGIINDCRARGVPVRFVLIPDEFQVNRKVLADATRACSVDSEALDLDWPQRRLVGFCAERDVPCLDLLPAFAAVPNTYAPQDTHWNALGNRLAATELGAWLRPRMRD
jgi:hypothetical protein